MNTDLPVRLAAFRFLEDKVRLHGEVLPRQLLTDGFTFEQVRVPLMAPQGIFKPAIMDMPLSITTVPPLERKQRPYEDQLGGDGLLYRYRGTDPSHRDNVGLREAMEAQVPLVYFYGVVPSQYLVTWPVYIVGDDPRTLTFTVQVDEPSVLLGGDLALRDVDVRRSYQLRATIQRLHQAEFRQRVIRAYRQACAVCRLRHDELLDAAHILPDGHPLGEPIVPNGLALCKLHHAAFDGNIIGIRPDCIVEVRREILDEIDGPMLQHGLQGAHGQRIVVPERIGLRPRTAFLEERYGLFRQAG
ncbi:MAG: HNH endonuclease [Chloroflexi bacterium]|nr:MAG: HNH endonuclease [Chloroflexota bacterium]